MRPLAPRGLEVRLIDKAVQKLALRWLKRKADRARKEGNGIMKALDGWKSLIVVLGFIGSSVYALASGQDIGVLVGALLSSMGWADATLIDRAKTLATVIAPLVLALWAAGSRIGKAVKQYRAGAKPGELLSIEGYVKQAQAEGLIPPKD